MTQTLNLFPLPLAGPPGLRYESTFISADEEQGLIAEISRLPLVPFQFGAYEGKRRVASFGWRYDYSERQLKKAEDIPAWLMPMIARIENFAGPASGSIGQVLCTEYETGVGIGWHRDKPHFGDVFGLSLASKCKLRLRSRSGNSWRRFTLDAEPRSLYIMTGEARNTWEHSVPPVEARRYSITFRTMR